MAGLSVNLDVVELIKQLSALEPIVIYVPPASMATAAVALLAGLWWATRRQD